MVKLVTKKASSEARQRADKIIRDVHKKLGKEYKFFCRPIGSQTRRCIMTFGSFIHCWIRVSVIWISGRCSRRR